MYKFSNTSVKRMEGLNPELIDVLYEGISTSPMDFGVASGYRTAEEQNELYQQGRTKPGNIVTYMDGYNKKSYHQSGNAVDIYAYKNGKASWEVADLTLVARHLQDVAKNNGIDLHWGGDWTSFKDYPHLEIKD